MLIFPAIPFGTTEPISDVFAYEKVVDGPFTALTHSNGTLTIAKNGANDGSITLEEYTGTAPAYQAPTSAAHARIEIVDSDLGWYRIHWHVDTFAAASGFTHVAGVLDSTSADPVMSPLTFAVPTGQSMSVDSNGLVQSNVKQWKDSVPADLADTDKVPTSIQHAASNVITASAIASGALAAIRDAILDRVLATNHDAAGTVGKVLQDIIEDTGTTLDAKIDAIDAVVDAIFADTDTTIPDLIAALNNFNPASDTVKLASDGLDAIDDSDVDAAAMTAGLNFRQRLRWLFQRLFNQTSQDGSTLIVRDDANTPASEQSITDVGGTQTVNKAEPPA